MSSYKGYYMDWSNRTSPESKRSEGWEGLHFATSSPCPHNDVTTGNKKCKNLPRKLAGPAGKETYNQNP